jgi:hypothetical protein
MDPPTVLADAGQYRWTGMVPYIFGLSVKECLRFPV